MQDKKEPFLKIISKSSGDAEDSNEHGFAYNEIRGRRPTQEDAIVWELYEEDFLNELTPQDMAHRLWVAYQKVNGRFNKHHPKGGTTASTTIMSKEHLITASLGDAVSFVVIYKEDGTVAGIRRLNSKIYTPELEVVRIQNVGGFVMYGRVSGVLAVSRAIGDTEYTGVCADALIDIASLKNIPPEYKIQVITACDGLTEGLLYGPKKTQEREDQEDYILGFLNRMNAGKPGLLSEAQVAQELVHCAYEDGSKDNISVSVQTKRAFNSEKSFIGMTGVYDGHGGTAASHFAADNMGEKLRKCLKYSSGTFQKYAEKMKERYYRDNKDEINELNMDDLQIPVLKAQKNLLAHNINSLVHNMTTPMKTFKARWSLASKENDIKIQALIALSTYITSKNDIDDAFIDEAKKLVLDICQYKRHTMDLRETHSSREFKEMYPDLVGRTDIKTHNESSCIINNLIQDNANINNLFPIPDVPIEASNILSNHREPSSQALQDGMPGRSGGQGLFSDRINRPLKTLLTAGTVNIDSSQSCETMTRAARMIFHDKNQILDIFKAFLNDLKTISENSVNKGLPVLKTIQDLLVEVEQKFIQKLTEYIDMIQKNPNETAEFRLGNEDEVSRNFQHLISSIKALDINIPNQEKLSKLETDFSDQSTDSFSDRFLKGGLWADIDYHTDEIKKTIKKHQYALNYLNSKENLKEIKETQAHINDLNLFEWISDDVRDKEWSYAKDELTKEPHGTKLSRKCLRNTVDIKHSFIKVGEKIIAMAPQGQYLGKGSSARVKLGQDEEGGLWGIKISGGKISAREVEITEDIGQSLASFNRNNKLYLTTVYYGLPLITYFKRQDPKLTLSERLELAANILKELRDLHQGAHSKTGLGYFHGDFSHINNVVIDVNGKPHLIDFGLSNQLKYLDPLEALNEINNDMSQLINNTISHMFREETYTLYPELRTLRCNNISDNIEILESIIKKIQSPGESHDRSPKV